MDQIEKLRESLPEAAKDIKLNLQTVFQPTTLTPQQLRGVAVSAINGCEMCVRSHEKVVIESGLTEDQVHDAVRVAATINAAALALEM